jgi:hypothetical protein
MQLVRMQDATVRRFDFAAAETLFPVNFIHAIATASNLLPVSITMRVFLFRMLMTWATRSFFCVILTV